MDNIICHISPTGGIDDRIAQHLDNGYTKEDIGLLRGLYDMDHPDNHLIPDYADEKSIQGLDLAKAAITLMEYKGKQAERHKEEMYNSTNHMARTFNQLYHVNGWNAVTRRNRINMVALEFSAEVSRRMAAAKKAGLSVTREQIVNGYKQNGQFHDGQLSIFETIFNRLIDKFNEAREILDDYNSMTAEELAEYQKSMSAEELEEDRVLIENANKIITEYPKIFQNWAALCTFARMSLRDTESLKLGQTLEYAAPTSPDNFSINSPMEDTYDLEESVREAWMTQQAETSAFGSLGSEIRRFLATISEVDNTGSVITDDLGYAVKMNPIETHQYLAELLRGVTSESGLIRKLSRMSSTDPRVKAIFDALAKAAQVDLSKSIDDINKPKNPVIITQLLLDMHKNMVPYSALLKKGSNVYAKILNRQANPLQDEFALRMQLHQKLDGYSSLYDNEGNVDWEKVAQWNTESASLLPAPEKNDTNSKNIFSSQKSYGSEGTGFWSKGYTYNQRIDYMKRAALAMGIPMTDKAARRIYNNASLRKSFLNALQEFRTETRNAFKGDVLNALKVLEKYQGIAPSINTGNTAEQREEYFSALNLLKEKNITYDAFLSKKYGKNQESSKGSGMERINRILDAVADVSESLKTERRVSWFDRKGKANSRYSDRTPSYMGDLVDKIHEFVNEGDAEGLKAFIMDKWGQSSFFYNKEEGRFLNVWLQEMYDSIRTDSKGNVIIDSDAMAKAFEFDEFLGSNIDKNVSIFENFTEKQHAEAMMKQFVQLIDQSHGKSKLAKYPCFILGDSGAQMFFTAKRYSRETILQGLRDVFRQEIERMKYVKATNEILARSGFKAIDNFSRTADEFTMLKFLNHDFENGKYWKILTGNQDMSDAEVKKLTKQEAVEIAREALGTDALTDALESYMNNALAEFKHKLASVGVLAESKGEGGAITYTDPKGYFGQNIKWFDNSIDKLVEDFYWNTKYATIQQLQLFTVDPAFYDHRYPIKDLQKRYKEIYAPGKGISIEARDFNGNLYTTRSFEKAVYFDDIAVSSEDVNPAFMKLIEDTFGKNSSVYKAYTKNTLTDGQGYRSLQSYRAVKGMAGEWTMAMENAYNRIMDIRNSGRELSEEDVKEIAQLAVIFQPIKPYLYTLEKLKINDEGDMALVPVQHKYAEVVLIPELMQEGKLRDVALWMENNDIDLVASTKCVKVGGFGATELKGANTTESINAALNKAFVHNLSWSDYRIQSGVPEHLNHAQLFGTQIRKLILANIDKGKLYNYLSNILSKDGNETPTVYLPGMGDVKLTGRNLVSFYNCLIMANLFDSYDRFSSESATNQKLSDKMIQNIISNSNQSEDNAFGFSIIDEGSFAGEFVVPLGEPGLEHDASALLFSLFKKQVNKQKIKGGSAVQASAMGLSGYEESGDLFEVVSPEGDNVLYDEIEMPFNVSYTSATGKDVKLRFEDWCNPDGTLKMSDQVVYGEDAKEYLSWPVSGRDKYGKAIDPSLGYYVPLIESKYKGILDIIAYRIPTERDYSMINCKVFRFSNPLAGGTLKVPSSRTTTAGFDFDIDKLYFFMREFAQTHLSDVDIENIWEAIYAEHPAWKEALLETRNLDRIGRKIFAPIAANFKDNAGGLGEMNEREKTKERLYQYWESAGLEGTPEEAFTKYLENHRKEYPVFDTYDPSASPLNTVVGKNGQVLTRGNSRVARNNMLIDLIRQRLMDKETLKARYTPGGFDNNRDAALRMRVLQFADKSDITTNGRIDWAKVDSYIEKINKGDIKDPEPEYDVSDPTAILVYNQQNQVAGKLIGIFANQNTNHVYASTMHELALRNPIKFGNHSARGLLDLLHAPEGIDVDTNVAEYLAASVDAVKDPVLNFLNLNLVTADAGAMLARIGYTPQEIGLLFNQPIIKDVCNYVANEGVSTDVAITEMLKQYGGKNISLDKINFDSSRVTSDKLADNILEQRKLEGKEKTSEFKQNQLQVLWLFNEILTSSADLNSFVQSTRFTAANSVGSTWGDQLAQEERVRQFVEKYMRDYDNAEKDPRRLSFQLFDPSETRSNRVVSLDEAILSPDEQGILNTSEDLLKMSPEEYMAQMSRNPLAFEQLMMDLSRKATRELFKKHFPYYTQLYDNMRTVMKGLTKYGGLDADTINSLHREFMVFLLSKQKGSSFDGEAPNLFIDDSGSISNREYYTRHYPLLLHALKAEGVLSGIPFFDAVTITGDADADAESKPLQIIVQGMGGLQTQASNLITEMWAQAFNSDEVVHSNFLGADIPIKQLAEDLYFYNFYKLGYNYHPTSSMSLAPTLLKLGLRIKTQSDEVGYIDFIKDVIDGNVHMDSGDLVLFAKQYMLNHLDNNKFVFTPKGSARSIVAEKAYNEQTGWNQRFSISYEQLGNSKSLFTISDKTLNKGEYAFRPIIAVEREGVTAYYMADSSGERFNVTSAANGAMTYRMVYAQGTRGQQIQYFGNDAFESYQRNGFVEKTRSMENVSNTELEATDGEVVVSPEGTHVEVGMDITNMFTDKEWNSMFQEFRQDHLDMFNREEWADFSVNDFKNLLLDTTDSQNVDILNDLARRIDRGEPMKTIDENGDETNVCGIA